MRLAPSTLRFIEDYLDELIIQNRRGALTPNEAQAVLILMDNIRNKRAIFKTICQQHWRNEEWTK